MSKRASETILQRQNMPMILYVKSSSNQIHVVSVIIIFDQMFTSVSNILIMVTAYKKIS